MKDQGDQKTENPDEPLIKKYKKKKGEFEIEAIDPIQDIMSDEELSEAEKRIKALLEDKDIKK